MIWLKLYVKDGHDVNIGGLTDNTGAVVAASEVSYVIFYNSPDQQGIFFFNRLFYCQPFMSIAVHKEQCFGLGSAGTADFHLVQDIFGHASFENTTRLVQLYLPLLLAVFETTIKKLCRFTNF